VLIFVFVFVFLLVFIGQFRAGDLGGDLGACWKIDLVASDEGGDQVAVLARRQRSEREARMLMHTVRSSGWCSLFVLKVLASCR
jgi:hypothetical protein